MDYEIQLLDSPALSCGEGPWWDAENQCLYFTEGNGKEIFSYDNITKQTALYYSGTHAASLTLHADGGLLISGADGFKLLTPQKEIHCYNDNVNGIFSHHLNDIMADPLGKVLAGQEAFKEDESYKPGYLFQLDTNGHLKVIEEGIHLSNGMGFSKDADTFYLTDTILRRIYQYKYETNTGAISQKKILIEFDKEHGLPDGLTVDTAGFLWVAMFLGNKILRIDPDGKIEREILLPFAQPTSLLFGGKDLNELFITSASMFWQTNLATSHHNYAIPRGGNLYKLITEFKGKEEFKAATLIP